MNRGESRGRELPSQTEHLGYLWQVAKLLEPFGFPLGEWYAMVRLWQFFAGESVAVRVT